MTLNDPELVLAEETAKPNTVVVVSLLVAAAAVFSWLWAYALTGALVANDLMRPWTPDHDPRPTHFVLSFVALLTLFLTGGAVARFLSARQLRRIDDMMAE